MKDGQETFKHFYIVIFRFDHFYNESLVFFSSFRGVFPLTFILWRIFLRVFSLKKTFLKLLLLMMAEKKQSVKAIGKMYRVEVFPSHLGTLWSFRAKTSTQSMWLPISRGWFPSHSFAGWKSWKLFLKILSIQALFSLCILSPLVASVFQQGTTQRQPRPRSRNEMTELCLHNPHYFQFEWRHCEET